MLVSVSAGVIEHTFSRLDPLSLRRLLTVVLLFLLLLLLEATWGTPRQNVRVRSLPNLNGVIREKLFHSTIHVMIAVGGHLDLHPGMLVVEVFAHAPLAGFGIRAIGASEHNV